MPSSTWLMLISVISFENRMWWWNHSFSMSKFNGIENHVVWMKNLLRKILMLNFWAFEDPKVLIWFLELFRVKKFKFSILGIRELQTPNLTFELSRKWKLHFFSFEFSMIEKLQLSCVSFRRSKTPSFDIWAFEYKKTRVMTFEKS